MKTFGKIEDEVVTFFKRLNYPFQVRGGGGRHNGWAAGEGGTAKRRTYPLSPQGVATGESKGRGDEKEAPSPFPPFMLFPLPLCLDQQECAVCGGQPPLLARGAGSAHLAGGAAELQREGRGGGGSGGSR